MGIDERMNTTTRAKRRGIQFRVVWQRLQIGSLPIFSPSARITGQWKSQQPDATGQ